MSDMVREQLLPAVDAGGQPFHILVLDDEADDGSILDARVESSLDPALDDLKQIPRAIVDLWEARPHTGATALPMLYATYIGYTATPQANFLQSDQNPLAPREFIVALRTPFDGGEIEPRETTYREPAGLTSYYTGGEAFYGRPVAPQLYVPTTGNSQLDLADAVRAFLVAGAISLWRDPPSVRLSEVKTARFTTRAEAIANCPKPHSMLVHPSASVGDQFEAAAEVLQVTCGLDRAASIELVRRGERAFPIDMMQREIDGNERAWTRWLDSYQRSAQAVSEAFDLPQPRRVPDLADWPVIRALLLDEIIPATKIKVVNSDIRADDRPQFQPQEVETDLWIPADDLSTVFVSGNVMSRGLTLEGLTTTVFLRSSENPFADSQMQMQRWFGYRGSSLELCRVILPQRQMELFRAYHDADEALRASVVAEMNKEADRLPKPFVLQGQDFTATGKLTNVANVPLCPGASPFVRLVNSGASPDPNVDLLASTFAERASRDLVVRTILRGRIVEQPLSLTEVADLLDRLRYENHRPTRDGWEGQRWKDIEAKIGMNAASDPEGLLPFFRPPPGDVIQPTPYSRAGPYAISAYLRLWNACLTRRARGLVATDSPRTPWAMANLVRKQEQQPRFYVGIRYGSGAEVDHGSLGSLPFKVRAMSRAIDSGELVGAWGSRNPHTGSDSYFGDEFFDYHFHERPVPGVASAETVWRPAGDPGLVLFYVFEREGRTNPAVAFGVALPLGGPDQFAARIYADGAVAR
jgi:hypothetical protein